MTCFELESFLYCKLKPLASEVKMGNTDFPIPVSFFYGDNDWVYNIEGETGGKTIVECNASDQSRFHIVPHAGHNLHMDNPMGFSNCIINDIFGEDLPTHFEPQEFDDFQQEFLDNVDTLTRQETQNLTEKDINAFEANSEGSESD